MRVSKETCLRGPVSPRPGMGSGRPGLRQVRSRVPRQGDSRRIGTRQRRARIVRCLRSVRRSLPRPCQTGPRRPGKSQVTSGRPTFREGGRLPRAELGKRVPGSHARKDDRVAAPSRVRRRGVTGLVYHFPFRVFVPCHRSRWPHFAGHPLYSGYLGKTLAFPDGYLLC